MADYQIIENKIKVGELELFYKGWLAENPKVNCIIVHGQGEHSGRYMNLIGRFAKSRVSFYSMDLRGHGASDGRKGHVDSFLDYIYDIKRLVNIAKSINPRLPVVMIGHSMGGALAARYSLLFKEDLSSIVLSSPAISPIVNKPGWVISASKLLGSVASKKQFSNGIEPKYLSHDGDTVMAYVNDPLVHNKATYKWYNELVSNGRVCWERAGEIDIPVLMLQGTDDRICDISGNEKFFSGISSEDKTFDKFDGLYHEIMNEVNPDRKIVLDTLYKWIMSRYVPELVSTKKSIKKNKTESVKGAIKKKK